MSERRVGNNAVGALGAALAWALAGPPLGVGGLAPLALAALAALVVGLPLAALERAPARAPGPRAARALAFTDGVAAVWTIGLAGAALGHLAPALGGPVGVAVAVAALTVAAPRGRSPLAACLVGAGVGAALATGAWEASAAGGPWTLLEPRWESVGAWGPAAVAGGLALVGAGFGRWREGADRAPAAVAGVALAVAIAVGLGEASAYEIGGATSALPARAHRIAGAAGALAVAIATLAPWTGPARPAWGPGFGLGITAIAFAGPLAAAREVWFSSVLLAGPALVAGVRAGVQRDPAAGALAAGLCAAAVFGWPGLPAEAGAAATLALFPVVALWVGGIAALRAAPEPA